MTIKLVISSTSPLAYHSQLQTGYLMTNEHDFNTDIQEILSANSQQRTDYFVEQVKHHQQVWILNDEDGAVMLTADDEDCIPVWSSW